jgi:hypothetical protein
MYSKSFFSFSCASRAAVVKGHVFLPKINILSVIFFLLNPNTS